MSEVNKFKTTEPVSATIMFDQMVKEDMKCPLCGEPMIRVKCSANNGFRKGISKDINLTRFTDVKREVSEFSIWICNMECDLKTIYEKFVYKCPRTL